MAHSPHDRILSPLIFREHLSFAAKLEIGVLRPEAAGQEAEGKRQKERGRRKEPKEVFLQI
ncbi:hypothetical protein QUB05_00095 [Microcoleus sp. F10-C6]|uniref:hypothetical protein n=1 Tax=unclassified Microcoleus TaxID=2642155 RepID=UPI002FD558E5